MTHLFGRVLVGFFGLITLYPFVWMVLSSFKSNREIYQPGNLLPQSFDPFSYRLLFSGDFVDFYEVLGRSLLFAGGQALFACLITSGCGYALAKGRFMGKSLLFLISLLVILYPQQTMSLALFEWMTTMGMTGNLYALIFSGVASGLGVVFFTQVFRKMPDELIDLATVEGQSPWGTFLTLLPLIMPALIAYWVLHFLIGWQQHLLPLLVLGSDQLTLPLALAKLADTSHRIPEAVGLAAGVVAMLPVMLVFLVCFRRLRSALSEWVVS